MDLCDASKEADSKNMSFLLSCGEAINKKKTIFGTFALLEAIKSFEKNRNIELVRTLILSGADINEQDTNGWTVLHHACERGLR
jgi:ankyrin repeat protein